MNIYFDNAATTPTDPEVVEAMLPWLRQGFGNPSSVHSYGRSAKTAVEEARKKIAGYFSVSPSEIFFTSGGSEANNTVLQSAVCPGKIQSFITSPAEHPSVLRCLEFESKINNIPRFLVRLLPDGNVNLDDLEELLKENNGSLVSLMHANNETGNLLDLAEAGRICRKHGALFHSDTVQTIGSYALDLQTVPIDYASCSAHKLHGPKGIGFLYVRHGSPFSPLMHGGSQEMNRRAGTENVAGICGLSKALEIACTNMDAFRRHTEDLKNYFIACISKISSGIRFNGDCHRQGHYKIVSVAFPRTEKTEMLLYLLDIEGIAVSGGSACASGSVEKSHVLNAIYPDDHMITVRFSFSKFNTREEVDICMAVLKKVINGM